MTRGTRSRDGGRGRGERFLLVIARSEATKQSILLLRSAMDCFASLAMTVDMPSHSRGAMRPEFCWKPCPRNTEGAGKTGCALHPRSRVRLHKAKLHTSIQVQRRTPGLPCAMALRLIR